MPKGQLPLDFNLAREIFKNSPLFVGVPRSSAADLFMHATTRRLEKKAVVYGRDEMSDQTFMLLVSGKLQIVDGKDSVQGEIGRGELVGEVGVVSPQHKRSVSVIAAEGAEALLWNVRDLPKDLWKIYEPILENIAWGRINTFLPN